MTDEQHRAIMGALFRIEILLRDLLAGQHEPKKTPFEKHYDLTHKRRIRQVKP